MPNNLITDDQKKEIKTLRERGLSINSCAKAVRVSYSAAWYIIHEMKGTNLNKRKEDVEEEFFKHDAFYVRY
jgi:molybdenum-dependent DNA-binding transcriptional regulator ModE